MKPERGEVIIQFLSTYPYIKDLSAKALKILRETYQMEDVNICGHKGCLNVVGGEFCAGHYPDHKNYPFPLDWGMYPGDIIKYNFEVVRPYFLSKGQPSYAIHGFFKRCISIEANGGPDVQCYTFLTTANSVCKECQLNAGVIY